MMKNIPSDIFQRLRPTCVKLSREPTRSGVQDLRNVFDQVESSSLAKLTEYLLFPLQLTLQRNGVSNELKQDAVDCIRILLLKVKVDKLNVFDDLFNLLTASLSAKEVGKVADISEELKLSIINCLNCLMDNSSLVIRSVIYRDRYLPSLGHAVSLLLAVAENEKARNLQVAALSCLRNISFCGSQSLCDLKNRDEEQHDELGTLHHGEEHEMVASVYDSAASTMASFLPGISMALARIICGDPKQGHVVLSSSIDTFGDLVSMVMNDKYVGELDFSEDDILSTLSELANLQAGSEIKEYQEKAEMNEKEQPTKTLKVNLNKEWFNKTAIKLQVLIEKLTSTSVSNSNWQVRLSVVTLCKKIFSNCIKSMAKSTSLLVDILVGFLEDEYSQVSMESKAVLEYMSKNQVRNVQTFSSVLEENLHCQLTALPRLMRTANDEKKLRTLNLLNGYIGLLGDRFSLFLTCASHLKKLSHAFIQVLEMDVSDVGIVEERTSLMHESAVIPTDTHGQNPLSFPAEKVTVNQYPRYRFRHFTDDKIRNAICQSCNLLGCYGNLALLVDHFLDLFHESKIHRKQVILILNEIILGPIQQEKILRTNSGLVTDDLPNFRNTLKSLVKSLLSTYTSEKNWNLRTSNSTESSEYTGNISTKDEMTLQVSKELKSIPGLSYKNLNSNILMTCLVLEGIGVFARVLRQDFDIYLIETLYLVLSKLGDSNAAVSRSAYGTLVLICQSCGYFSVEELITRNADYLVNSIASDLKYMYINQHSPRVLQVMLQYGGPDILTIIEDTLNDIFAVLDLYPDQIMASLVKVLNTLVCLLHKWFAGSKNKENQVNEKKQIPESHYSGGRIRRKLTKDEFAQKVNSNLLQYIERKRIVLGEVEMEKEEETATLQDNENLEDEDLYSTHEEPELPLHVRYATQVLEKCIHFLSSSSSMLRILVLDTVYHGVLALKESENDLLPMIHRLWPSLVNRLNDKDQVVIVKAVDVITTMAECSGDFMRRRVIKDVIPRLLTYLEKEAEVSAKAGPVYTHSQACKLQIASLKGLGRLCKQLEISELRLDAAARVCSLYLSCRQPVELQQVASQIFDIFFTLEPDAMWLVLNNIYCPEIPQAPQSMFAKVILAGVKPERKEFATNVTCLLRKLEEY